MTKPLFLFVGKSASGKTTVAELLESRRNLKTLQSYTTRQKRFELETGHTFITDEEFDNLKEIIAYTEYNNHRYCATKAQIDEADIYVIDVAGVEVLLEKYQDSRPIVVIYFDTSIRTRIDRMINRNDPDTAIISRIYNDEEFEWERELSKLVWNAKNNENKNVEIHVVDANRDLDNVLLQTWTFMNSYLEM